MDRKLPALKKAVLFINEYRRKVDKKSTGKHCHGQKIPHFPEKPRAYLLGLRQILRRHRFAMRQRLGAHPASHRAWRCRMVSTRRLEQSFEPSAANRARHSARARSGCQACQTAYPAACAQAHIMPFYRFIWGRLNVFQTASLSFCNHFTIFHK